MSSSSDKDGFTLVEILVAMAIIVTIVSMVYGSYFATSKSAQAYKSRITLSQQGRKVLGQMTRQIRCSYASKADKNTYPAPIPQQGKADPAIVINYFNGNSDEPSGEILHLVTTNGFSVGLVPSNGLFEVTYKLYQAREDSPPHPKVLSRKKNGSRFQKTSSLSNWHSLMDSNGRTSGISRTSGSCRSQ